MAESKSEGQRRQEAESLAYITDDRKWFSSVCPLIRYLTDGDKECGYMLDSKYPLVYIGNIFEMSTADRVIAYDTHSAIINDGWLVD